MSLNSPGEKEVEEVHQEIQSNLKNPQLQIASTENGLHNNLKLASQEVLERAQQIGRSRCPKCSSSRMFYCYSCYVLVETVPVKKIPAVKLPLKIDIIKHPNETDGKSTAVHAKLLAPEDVTIYTYPCIPEYEDKRHEIVLVFPGPGSVSVEDCLLYLPKCAQTDTLTVEPFPKRTKCTLQEDRNQHETKLTNALENAEQIEKKTLLRKVVFIDSTWNQTNKIISDERLQGLVQVELKKRKTCFWRHQKGKPDTYLSTIEAVYYFLVDYHTLVLKETYKGEYDNLLFFFSFMYKLIKTAQHSAGKI
ncbi:DTW domain-containing protein 1 [Rhinatrema bivittatum]|uniref:DTW domain-containing protein 1 n=1 Tax=Rhinatrema bivittatum TaxID=194408 RepID=UPI001126673A|nr:DTW domain-containing protein 1 [Rhinatrema bivittatum]XP_029431571.1 DTW domain-containing protein 1 [Rhinatrema bivittatum]